MLTSVPSPPHGPYVAPNPHPDVPDQRGNVALRMPLPDCGSTFHRASFNHPIFRKIRSMAAQENRPAHRTGSRDSAPMDDPGVPAPSSPPGTWVLPPTLTLISWVPGDQAASPTWQACCPLLQGPVDTAVHTLWPEGGLCSARGQSSSTWSSGQDPRVPRPPAHRSRLTTGRATPLTFNSQLKQVRSCVAAPGVPGSGILLCFTPRASEARTSPCDSAETLAEGVQRHLSRVPRRKHVLFYFLMGPVPLPGAGSPAGRIVLAPGSKNAEHTPSLLHAPPSQAGMFLIFYEKQLFLFSEFRVAAWRRVIIVVYGFDSQVGQMTPTGISNELKTFCEYLECFQVCVCICVRACMRVNEIKIDTHTFSYLCASSVLYDFVL